MDFAAALEKLEKTANAAANTHDRRRGRPDTNHHPRNQRPRHSYNPNDRSLDSLIRFGYRLFPYRSSAPPANYNERPKHLCLCALTIDELPFEHLWKAWCASNTSSNSQSTIVSLVCHAKFPDKVKSPWLKQRLLTRPPRMGRGNSYADPEYFTHKPEWGSVEITRAMIDVLRTAMQIGVSKETDPRFAMNRFVVTTEDDTKVEVPPVDKFLFISETCIPVCTLQECEQALFGTIDTLKAEAAESSATTTRAWETSWVNARNRQTPGTPRNKYERDQFQDLHPMVPQGLRTKADQWMCLSRPHVQAVLGIDGHLRPADQLFHSFARINASDELYFPTVLALLGIWKDNIDNSSQVLVRPVTFTDWSEGMRNPATFVQKDLMHVATQARAQGCLVARKFAALAEISVDEWTSVVMCLPAYKTKVAATVDSKSQDK